MLSERKYGNNAQPRPININVGDWVRIHTDGYCGITGKVIDIDNFCEFDDFDYHVLFDTPLGSGLDNEFFAYEELELIDCEDNETIMKQCDYCGNHRKILGNCENCGAPQGRKNEHNP